MIVLSLGLGMTAWGCTAREPAAAGPPPVPEVAVVTLAGERVVLSTELPGRTAAYLVAEVRPQVTGIVQSRQFEEGQDVQAGDVLYQIDPARYDAAFARAKASLAMAEADLPALRAKADRYKSATAERAISQQAYDEAVAALDQAAATVAARRADVTAAQIDLDYTRITAPISGRIGKSNITVGALATANQPEPLTTIHQFDPIYVDVTQSSAELLRLRRDLATGTLQANEAVEKTVHLRLEDGTAYALTGTLQFRDIAVDSTTGSYTLRMLFPNPDRLLLPGMFVRATIEDGALEQAVLAPQQGVSRSAKGEPIALVVDDANVVQQRVLTLGRALGNRWLVESGLVAGDRLIVEGMLKVRPGATVKAVAFGAAEPKPASAAGYPGAATN